jgi:hypothetical protein
MPSEQLFDLDGGNRRNLWMRGEISLSGRPTGGRLVMVKTLATTAVLIVAVSRVSVLPQSQPLTISADFSEGDLANLSYRYFRGRADGTTSPALLGSGAIDIENDRILGGSELLASRSIRYATYPSLYPRFYGEVGLVTGTTLPQRDAHFLHVWTHESSGWRLLVAHFASLAPNHREPSMVLGGGPGPLDSDVAERDQVKAVEGRRLEALAQRRYADYRQLYAMEYSAITQAGAAGPKEIFEDLAGGVHFVNDLDVRIVGPVAIIRGSEGDGPYRLRFTRVWVRRTGEYLCVAEALTPAPPLGT